jgi:hypothetical protein
MAIVMAWQNNWLHGISWCATPMMASCIANVEG